MIREFRGDYRFLSNFWYVDILYDNVYPTNEHFFQAMKTTFAEARAAIAMQAAPRDAKRLGRIVPLRPGWDSIKLAVMELGLRKKFSYPQLAHKLMETYPQALIEGNYWNDKYWGVDLRTGEGENHLGRLLQIVRADLMNHVPLIKGPDPIF